MSVAALFVNKETISIGEHEFPVRGLSLSDLARIVGTFRDLTAQVYEAVQNVKDTPLEAVFLKVAEDAPLLVAEIIGAAIDEPENVHQIALWPTGHQLKVVQRAIELTFEVEDSLGKFLSVVAEAAKRPPGAAKENEQPLKNETAGSSN